MIRLKRGFANNPQNILLILLLIFYASLFVKANVNGCDNYVKCRNDLLEAHWKCAEPLRRLTQNACKIKHLYADHKKTSYNLESLFNGCTSKYSDLNDIDYLLGTDSLCYSFVKDNEVQISKSTNCWSNLVRLTQKCYSLSRCCPAAKICGKELNRNILYEQFNLEKITMKKLLEKCSMNMDKMLQTETVKDDEIIAKQIKNAANELLNTIVPFRINPDFKINYRNKKITENVKKPREFGTASLTKRNRKKGKRPKYHQYGISKPKYRIHSINDFGIVPPTTSLRPFTLLDSENLSITSSEPPGFSPRTFHSIDFSTRSARNFKKGKKRKLRKRKNNYNNRKYIHKGTIMNKNIFNVQHAAAKLDKLSEYNKMKGEFSGNFIPKMKLVKQNQGMFLGFAQPIAKPIENDLWQTTQPSQTIEEIYDDLIESQVQDFEKNQKIQNIESVNFTPPPDPTTVKYQNLFNEAFINNKGAWTLEPMSISTEPPPTVITVPPTTTKRFEKKMLKTVKNAKIKKNEPIDLSEMETTIPTTIKTISTKKMEEEEEEIISTTKKNEAEIQKTTPLIDPFVDYITHELLEKHMEEQKNDDDQFDFSSADYIDISAMDINPTKNTEFDIVNYEKLNTSTEWPQRFETVFIDENSFKSSTQRTTSSPLSAENLSSSQSNDLIPLPPSAELFSSNHITPSPIISTTTSEDHLWPIPIQRKHRMKMMGEKVLQYTKPIILLPMNKKNEEKMKEYKKKLIPNCQKYDQCLRKEIEMKIKCAVPYPKAYDKCSAQLLPLYKLIDDASNNKLQFFVKCIGKSTEMITNCQVIKKLNEEEVTCENIEEWSNYCKSLGECCPSKDYCNSISESDNVGRRLRLLEKSFSLRASACQFKYSFHRSLFKTA